MSAPDDRSRNVLMVRGGWEGHRPVEACDRFQPFLAAAGYQVTVSDTLDAYADRDLMDRTALVVQCWTMGDITAEQVSGLRGAVASGTGLAGWHGGIVDAFRSSAEYLQLVGGQFAAHPGDFVDHSVEIVPERAEHPIVAGVGSLSLHTEQYWVLSDARNDVLATTTVAVHEGDAWDSPVTSPAVWTRTWGRGRVFVCTVGHRPEDLDVPGVRTIVERGLLWAAR